VLLFSCPVDRRSQPISCSACTRYLLKLHGRPDVAFAGFSRRKALLSRDNLPRVYEVGKAEDWILTNLGSIIARGRREFPEELELLIYIPIETLPVRLGSMSWTPGRVGTYITLKDSEILGESSKDFNEFQLVDPSFVPY